MEIMKSRPQPGDGRHRAMRLTARGFNISDGTSARITACTDLVQLRCWLILAATTQTLENLFNEPVC